MYLLHNLTTVLGGLAALLSSPVYLTPEVGTFLCFQVLLRPWRGLRDHVFKMSSIGTNYVGHSLISCSGLRGLFLKYVLLCSQEVIVPFPLKLFIHSLSVALIWETCRNSTDDSRMCAGFWEKH